MTKTNNIRPLYLVLCEKTVTDQISNNITAMNITEQINIATDADKDDLKKALEENPLINVPIRLTLLSAWDFNQIPNAFSLEMKIVDPNKKTLISDKKNIEVNDRTKRRQRVNHVFQSFPVSVQGIYTIEQVMTAGKDTSIQRTYVEVRAPFLK